MLKRCTVNDPNYDSRLTFLALERDELIGVLIGVERTKAPKEVIEAQRNMAWIKTIAISPKHRNKYIFNRLLNAFLSEVEDKDEIKVANFAVWHFHPGVDVEYEYYLENYLVNDFVKYGEVVDYELDLKYFYTPTRVLVSEEKLKEEGVCFEIADSKQMDEAKEWIKTKFSPYWALEAEIAVGEDRGGLWLSYDENKFLGFSTYGALEPNWFGPIGVDEKARNLGIGSVLLFKALNSMRLNGMRHVVVPWTRHLFFYSQIPGIIGIRHYYLLKLSL